ncbi:hypothetical protein P9314_15565 [Paenibacillus validus]|uniref:Lipoprotein n=1 Tax=Paenibacillus validus TaxID=44253 RepID=A0A7X3CWA2_9BACL|nr:MULTISPECIES: hypothetical protein [Paenibacillus]MED4602106.1 hypothetical protein [Paenibacillus validus]MED4607407.1 hypothetical protein [Paenibacillus validus]MUG73959.1 hypothetical protein [Paenibacillus validus]
MRYLIIGLLFCFTVPLVLTAGCGKENAPDQQSRQQSDKPIDTELQQQMKMYQEIKKQEYEQNNQRRTAEKKRLKELQKTQEEALRHELEFQEKVRQSGNPLSSDNNDTNNQQGSDQELE